MSQRLDGRVWGGCVGGAAGQAERLVRRGGCVGVLGTSGFEGQEVLKSFSGANFYQRRGGAGAARANYYQGAAARPRALPRCTRRARCARALPLRLVAPSHGAGSK